MLDMMQRMMGKEPGEKPGNKPGQKPGNSAGDGSTGDSNAANSGDNNGSALSVGERTVPKSSGSTGAGLPDEFQAALEAYNRSNTE